MDDWKKWAIVAGGAVAVVGHWVPGYWLDVIGGAVVVVVALMPN